MVAHERISEIELQPMVDEFPTDLPSYTLQDISLGACPRYLPVTTLSLDDFDTDTDLLSRSDFDSATSSDFDYSPAPPARRSRPDVSEPAPQVPLPRQALPRNYIYHLA